MKLQLYSKCCSLAINFGLLSWDGLTTHYLVILYEENKVTMKEFKTYFLNFLIVSMIHLMKSLIVDTISAAITLHSFQLNNGFE